MKGRTEDELAKLAATWAALTDYKLDRAQRWWDAGLDPGKAEQLIAAIEGGLRVEDLGEIVHGRTIAEHLQAGNSPRWCLSALHWRRSA